MTQTSSQALGSAHSAPSSKDCLPTWFRVLAILGGVFIWLLLSLGTLLVWAFRSSTGPSLAPYLLGMLVLCGLYFLSLGRRVYGRLMSCAYRFVSCPLGGGLLFVSFFALLGFVGQNILPAGQPVLSAQGRKVAVIGGGSAGMHAAWMLKEAGIDFELYEAADYIGGHAYAPVFTPEQGEPFACDIGFIFGSPTDYQEMKVLMDWYGVARNPSELGMSGQVDGYKWASGPEVSAEAQRFQQLALEQHQDPKWNLVPFGTWLELHHFDEKFRNQYLTPMMSVLFITDLGLYQVSTRFMLNMAAGRMQWIDFLKGAPAWTVKGGSVKYYAQLGAEFKERIHLKSPVAKVERKNGKVLVSGYDAQLKPFHKTYDDVIFAVPADVAKTLLTGQDALESFVLGEVRYKDSEVILHTDESLLPEPKYRRQYNYYQDNRAHPGEFELSGIMNWVHGAGEMKPLPIGSLHPLRPIDPKKILLHRGWRHHSMDLWHLALMLKVMPQIQGRGHVWYAGDWVTVIGHGPAMRTGMAAACNVGAKSRVKKAPEGARCIDVRTEEERAGKPAVNEHLCGKEEIFEYLVERNCNGFKL